MFITAPFCLFLHLIILLIINKQETAAQKTGKTRSSNLPHNRRSPLDPWPTIPWGTKSDNGRFCLHDTEKVFNLLFPPDHHKRSHLFKKRQTEFANISYRYTELAQFDARIFRLSSAIFTLHGNHNSIGSK